MKSLKTLSALKKFIVVGTASVLCSTMLALPSVSATPGSDFTTAYSATTGTLLTESLWMGIVNNVASLMDTVDAIASNFTSNNKLKAPASTETCDGSIAGAIRYESGIAEICNGTSWSAMGGATTDTTPNAIVFTDQTLASPNTTVTSNDVIVSGFDGPLTAYCGTNCTGVRRNTGAFASSASGFMPGDTITIRLTSNATPGTKVATVSLGNTTSVNWTVTTVFASGGTEYTYSTYKIHKFTENGTFQVSGAGNVDILVVGGGGGGGNYSAGGGGAGGLVYCSLYGLTAGPYSVVVGTGAIQPVNSKGLAGNNSSFGSIIAIGGGGGEGYGDGESTTKNGGSGGGGRYPANQQTAGISTQTSPAGCTGFGNAGGAGTAIGGQNQGGGGGAGAPGQAGSGGNSGNGGVGKDYSSIFGTSVGVNGWFAGGGGAEGWSGTDGAGGAGGGGNSAGSDTANGQAGVNYTGGGGGGGGGGGYKGGNGGKGIVLIRYAQ